jgi:hypothetical protein
METSRAEMPTCSFWSGTAGRNDMGAWTSRTSVPLDPGAASLLPRIVCVEDAVVTLDDRRGMRLRQIAWTGPPHRAMDAMQSLRALADLDAMLARHDHDARAPAPPLRTRRRRPAAATTPVGR